MLRLLLFDEANHVLAFLRKPKVEKSALRWIFNENTLPAVNLNARSLRDRGLDEIPCCFKLKKIEQVDTYMAMPAVGTTLSRLDCSNRNRIMLISDIDCV